MIDQNFLDTRLTDEQLNKIKERWTAKGRVLNLDKLNEMTTDEIEDLLQIIDGEDFVDITDDRIDSGLDFQDYIEAYDELKQKDLEREEKRLRKILRYAIVHYEEWQGKKDDWKLVHFNDMGTIKNNMFTSYRGKRKRVTGKHFEVVRYLSAEEYEELLKDAM